MIGFKIVGSILVIGSSVLYSRIIYTRCYQYVCGIRRMHQILTLVMQQIEYARLALPELFQQIAIQTEEPYHTWLHSLSRETSVQNEIPFQNIWSESILQNLNSLHFKEEHLDIMIEFGRQLSFNYYEPKTAQMSIILQQFISEITEEEKKVKIKQKLCCYFGVMGGLFLVILLF